MYYVYILKSEIKNRFYIGLTTNLDQRINQHNNGETKSTKAFRPWKIIYSEEYREKQEAYKREWHLKHPKGYLDKLSIIEKYT